VNGAGKTSLLGLLSGRIQPTAGRVRRGKTVRPAELRQDVENLDAVADLTAVEVVEGEQRRIIVGGKELTAAQLVERLGFPRERARTRVGDLSGGERRRLQLLRLLVGEPNVLLLDEPTNDLDTDTLAVLEDLLDSWPGTLIVVSHDRYLLERVADRQVALLGDGTLRDLPGGVDEYLALRAAAATSSSAPASPQRASAGRSGESGARTSGEAATGGGGVAAPDAAAVRAARKEVTRIERRLARLDELEADLHEQLAARATDHAVVLDLDTRLRALAAERAELEEAWLTAAEVGG
jgi:ABC-type multidrug transport system ATPase subunit